jgi:hypothetical protein
MKSSLLAPFAFFAAISSAACSNPSGDGAASSSAADTTSSPSTDVGRQVFHRIAKAEADDVLTRFIRDNDASWTVKPVVDPYLPFVRHIESTVASGPAVTSTVADLETRARAFLVKNASTLGLTESETASLEFGGTNWDARNEFDTSRIAGSCVLFHVKSPQPGYEAFDSVGTFANFAIAFLQDGQIEGVDQMYTTRLPTLSISTTPALAGDNPAAMAKLIGADFPYWDAFIPACILYKRSLGPIAASDLGAPSLTMDVKADADLVVTLGYTVDVLKTSPDPNVGTKEATFVVSAATGEILETPKPPCTPHGG